MKTPKDIRIVYKVDTKVSLPKGAFARELVKMNVVKEVTRAIMRYEFQTMLFE